MNTQKIPSSRSKGPTAKMGGFMSKKGLELALDEDRSQPSFKPSKPKMIASLEDEQPISKPSAAKDKHSFGGMTKGEDPTNFANENVMSKSNLRQPKSFSFGFDDGSDSEEAPESKPEHGDPKEEEKLPPSSTLTFEEPEELELPTRTLF